MKPKPLFAAAHVVTKLSPAGGVEHGIEDWHEPHGSLQSVVHQDPTAPGVMLHARLGASGVQLLRLLSPEGGANSGNIAVCIPLETLFALATEINPAFGAPRDRMLSTAELAALSAPAPAATA